MSRGLARLRVHLRLIEDGVAPVARRYAEHMQCRPGCGQCCRQTFRVSNLEGALLREGLSQLDAPTRADILARARAWRPDADVPCPVLDDDERCRLYAHRPRICRKYGIPLWHPDRPHEVRTCPLNFQGVADIDPELVLEPQASWAEDWIRVRQELQAPLGPDRPIATHLLDDASPE